MSWNVLIDETAIAELLPVEYARFARPVKEGLVVFLSGLPSGIQEAILAEQAALPLRASLSERLGLLARSCPVLHKFGQIIARDPRLAPELRDQLRPLESLPPSANKDAVHKILVHELGPLETRGIALSGSAIAEASVAIVVPYRDVRNRQQREGVLKVLKPGIEERLELELELLSRVGTHLDENCEKLSIPQIDYRDTFEQVRDKLRWEVRLDQEQRHLTEAAALYADDPDVMIPALFDPCTERGTAMERVDGVKVTDHAIRSAAGKRRLAELVARALVAHPIYSRLPRAMFHSDPHAGNLLYTHEGRLAILDWSLVGHLGESERIAMGQIVLAAVALDANRIVAELTRLANRKQVNRAVLRTVVDNWLRRIRRGQFPGMAWLVGMLDEATQVAQLRVASDMMLFRKLLHTVDGVINDLGADQFRMEEALLAEFLLHFGRECLARWFATPTSRTFATRLSNADLAGALLGMPLAAMRFWQAEIHDFLKRPAAKRQACKHVSNA